MTAPGRRQMIAAVEWTWCGSMRELRFDVIMSL